MNIDVLISKYMKNDIGRISAVEYSAVFTHTDFAGISSQTSGLVASDLDAASTVDDMKNFVSALISGDMNLTSVHMSDIRFKYMLANSEQYTALPPLSPEELRAQMPDKTPREFRDTLVDMGIFPQQVTNKINEIPFDIERQKALNAWEVATMISRVDPYVDMIGAMFDISPEDIDAAW